jgi:hypothetical protein
MMYLEYEDVKLPILDGYNITKSSQEIAFSDIKCEFTGNTVDKLPDRYEEVRITEKDKCLFLGYVEDFYFDEMREIDEDVYVNFTLLSPRKITTLRTCIAVGTYEFIDLICVVLAPLLDDGFTIKELDVFNKKITVNFLVETVEYCLNNLSNKFNFWWDIDENKNIYIKDITKMINQKPDVVYNDNNRPAGLEYIKPITNSDNYANVINFKNVRIYEKSFYNEGVIDIQNDLISNKNLEVKSGDTVNFNYPIDVNPKNTKKVFESLGVYTWTKNYILQIQATCSDGATLAASIDYDDENGVVYSSNIGIEGQDDKKEILLVRDSFFSNLIIGFRFNNENKKITKFTKIVSNCILKYNVNKLYNDKGISEKAGKISKTGIVEITVDMNESWKTIQELAEIGSSYLNKNSLEYADEIEMKLDKDIFKIGHIVEIDRLIIKGKYVVTKIQITDQQNDCEYIVRCKRANLLSNYIDIFRSEKNQVSDEKTYNLSVTHYEEEGLVESHEVIQ